MRAATHLKEVKRLDGTRRRFESVITGIFSNDAVRADATCICATGFRGKGRKVIYRCWRLARAVRLDRRFIQQALAHLGELHQQGARADQNRDHAHANAMTGAREQFCFNFNRNRQALSPTSRQADPIGWRRALERADLVIPHADGIYSIIATGWAPETLWQGAVMGAPTAGRGRNIRRSGIPLGSRQYLPSRRSWRSTAPRLTDQQEQPGTPFVATAGRSLDTQPWSVRFSADQMGDTCLLPHGAASVRRSIAENRVPHATAMMRAKP